MTVFNSSILFFLLFSFVFSIDNATHTALPIEKLNINLMGAEVNLTSSMKNLKQNILNLNITAKNKTDIVNSEKSLIQNIPNKEDDVSKNYTGFESLKDMTSVSSVKTSNSSFINDKNDMHSSEKETVTESFSKPKSTESDTGDSNVTNPYKKRVVPLSTDAMFRGLYVIMGIAIIVLCYFGIKYFRIRRRQSRRKYRIIARGDDREPFFPGSDDDEGEEEIFSKSQKDYS